MASSITTANITLVLEPGVEFYYVFYNKCENGIVSFDRFDVSYEEAYINETTTINLNNVIVGSFICINAYAAPHGLDVTTEPMYALEHIMDDMYWKVTAEGDITVNIAPYDEFGIGGWE